MSSVMNRPVGRRDTITSGQNGYWLIKPTRQDVHSVQLVHHDGTSAGTWSVYSSNDEDQVIKSSIPAAGDTPDAEIWSLESAPVMTQPSGTAAGSFMLHLSASGAKAYLIRFEATANSVLSLRPHGKD